jgi:hypothetical protein
MVRGFLNKSKGTNLRTTKTTSGVKRKRGGSPANEIRLGGTDHDEVILYQMDLLGKKNLQRIAILVTNVKHLKLLPRRSLEVIHQGGAEKNKGLGITGVSLLDYFHP